MDRWWFGKDKPPGSAGGDTLFSPLIRRPGLRAPGFLPLPLGGEGRGEGVPEAAPGRAFSLALRPMRKPGQVAESRLPGWTGGVTPHRLGPQPGAIRPRLRRKQRLLPSGAGAATARGGPTG